MQKLIEAMDRLQALKQANASFLHIGAAESEVRYWAQRVHDRAITYSVWNLGTVRLPRT